MKKILSLLLSVLMLASCFSVITVNAAEINLGDIIYSEETVAASEAALKKLVVNGLPNKIESLDQLIGSGAELLGITPEFLYSDEGALIWSTLDVYERDESGNLVLDLTGNPKMIISKDDVTLAMLNLNIYLQRVIYDIYGGMNLYTVKNAIALTNVVGNMFKPDFAELNPKNFADIFGNETPSTNEFFEKVAELSGLGNIVENNWLTKGRSFCEPLVKVLGAEYVTFYSEYYNKGYGNKLASKVLEGMVQKILTVGPIEFAVDLLKAFSSSGFEHSYRDPALALFSHKYAAFTTAGYTEEELMSFDGLLKLIFCDCDAFDATGCYTSTEGSADHFCPFNFPSKRYSSAADDAERYVYLFYYLNICGKYRSNNAYFKSLQNKISNSSKLSSDDKTKLNSIIDGFFLGNFISTVDTAIIPIYKENISTASDSLFDRFRNAMMGFLKKIADYFDYLRKIFSGELNYGQGNSPFN